MLGPAARRDEWAAFGTARRKSAVRQDSPLADRKQRKAKPQRAMSARGIPRVFAFPKLSVSFPKPFFQKHALHSKLTGQTSTPGEEPWRCGLALQVELMPAPRVKPSQLHCTQGCQGLSRLAHASRLKGHPTGHEGQAHAKHQLSPPDAHLK